MVQLVTVVSTCKTTQGTHASMNITIFKSCQVHNTMVLQGLNTTDTYMQVY